MFIIIWKHRWMIWHKNKTEMILYRLQLQCHLCFLLVSFAAAPVVFFASSIIQQRDVDAQRFSGWVSHPLHRMDAGFFAFDKAAFKFAPRGVLMVREQAVFKTTQLFSFDVA